ncbi:MAG: NAD-dependent epimerase/dehydratase family protein [Rhodobacteraceae bacterium]|nr:NAD-dependent epimerase/dehydratase family protein [Paracoccaceae bacterium]
MPRALVTGSAGFIGAHLCARLLDEGWEVTGLDGMLPYYSLELKDARLDRLKDKRGFRQVTARLEEPGVVAELMAEVAPDIVVHLAAEAGVRNSIENPRSYLMSNVVGTFEILEAVRAHPPRHTLIASTSSAYGANTDMPYVETMRADHQVSPYAATKKSTEVLAHAHSHLFDLPITMFRFFTVYGPWGRPDMAYYLFADAIRKGEPIKVFNHGKMQRDFVFIDDLIEAIRRLIDTPPVRPVDRQVPEGDSLSPVAPFRVVNIGKSDPDTLMAFIEAIEDAMGQKADKIMMDMQPGDVPATWADASLLQRLTGYLPRTPLTQGMPAFVEWFRAYNRF